VAYIAIGPTPVKQRKPTQSRCNKELRANQQEKSAHCWWQSPETRNSESVSDDSVGRINYGSLR